MFDSIRLFVVSTLLAGVLADPPLTVEAANRPNIVLLESDDHRLDALG